MSQKRDHIIGVRLTKEEKEEIEEFTNNQGLNLTEFIRKAISAYQKDIEEDSKKIHIENVINYSKKVKSSLKSVKTHFNNLNSALNELSHNFNRLDEELYFYMMIKGTT